MRARLPTRGRVLRSLFLGVALILTLGAGYTALTLAWSYSEGERAGTLLKVSNKGWLCKTWEGELIMALVASGNVPGDQSGISSNTWMFTVRDDSVLDALSKAVGKRVVLHYTEHKGVPSTCFGETPYYVDAVRIDDGPAPAAR